MNRRISVFDHPFLLGFDEFERALDRVSQNTSDNYPPYNIEQISETRLRITIAVAGFDYEDLSVQLEHNQLIIRASRPKPEEEKDHIFLHRGIATRQFQRAFILADDIEILNARLHNGLLCIELERIVPETVVKTIEIEKPGKADINERTLDVEKREEDD